jgi:predicted RNA methylase
MARLAAQEKLEFYPTPEEEIENILENIKLKGTIRVLDPCAGDGRFFRLFKKHYPKADYYGIELDTERYQQCCSIISRGQTEEENKNKFFESNMLNADALEEVDIMRKGCFNLLFLNPPYDYYAPTGERIEYEFLKKYTPYLHKGGVLIFIINPSAVTMGLSYYLLSHYKLMFCYKITVDTTYHQFMLIGRRYTNYPDDNIVRKIQQTLYYEPVNTQADGFQDLEKKLKLCKVDLPPVNDLMMFRAIRINPEKVAEVKGIADDLWNRQITSVINPPPQKIRSLMPLRKAHIALLLTTGKMNGYLKGTPYVIKGKCKNAEMRTDQEEQGKDGKTKRVTKIISHFVPSIKVLNIETGDIKEVK